MNTIRLSSLVLVICLFCTVASPQYRGPVGNGHERKRWADPPERSSAIYPSDTPDPRDLKKDADELAQLSQAIPSEIEGLNHGLVPSDLNEKLRRIEKLSKKLRDAVGRSRR